MAKYLITGGAGFIGSHIVKKLVESGEQVVVLDNFSTGYEKNLAKFKNKIEIINDDVRDLDALKKAFKGVDFVSHHAAQISVPLSIKNPSETLEINGQGTLNVLLAAQENNVKKVIIASSSAVYGDTVNLSIKESEPVKPLSPYAVSKLLGEYYCQTFNYLYGIDITIFRYFNVYGEGQDPDSPYAAAIPKFIEFAKHNKPITIFGDGTQTRDFIHVSDVVEANITAFSCKTGNSPINIGSGEKIEIRALAPMISKNISFVEERKGDIKHSLADISYAKGIIGFKPKVKLAKGLKALIAYSK